MKKLDAMLFRMMKQSKGQFIAVLVIILVGIAIFTALTMAATNLDNTKTDYYEDGRFADLYAEAERVPATVVTKLQGLPGIAAAEGRLVMDVPFIAENDERVNVRLMSAKGDDQQTNLLFFSEGRKLKNTNEDALVSTTFAEARGIRVGDEIQVQVNGVRYTLSVCGIVQSPEFIYTMENEQSLMPTPDKFGVVYISEALAQQVFSLQGAYNQVTFLYDKDAKGALRDGTMEAQLIDSVETRLEPYGLTRTIKMKDQMSNSIVTMEIDNLKAACVALPILFLLVAALVLMMMLSRMVKRDRIKIGVLKALGYSNRQILMHYVKYSLIAGFAGGVLGILLGMAIAGYMTELYIEFFAMPSYGMKFYYGFYGLALLLSCAFSVLSGVLGAREALRIDPAESMQSEAPKAGKRILLEKIPGFWKRLSFSRKMIVKNIFRNKKRSAFILAGVALTYGMMLFTLTMPQVIDEMMVKYFTEFQRMDYNVSFYKPVTKQAVKDMTHELPEAYIEGKIEYPFELSVGNKNKTLNIIGIPRDTNFYSLTDVKGNPLLVESGGMLLSENMAKFLKVSPGDKVKVQSFLPGGRDATLPVTGIVKQSLGINAYMEIEDMGRRLLEANAVTGVYIGAQDQEIVPELRGMETVSTITSTQEMKDAYGQFLGLIILCIGCMLFLSGILGFCIVYNATIVSLGEREMEFSSLRVLGFSKDEIFRMVLSENVILSFIGMLVGVPIGFAMTSYSSTVFSTDLYCMYMSPTYMAAINAFIMTALFLLCSQLAAHQKVNGLDFLQALKNRAS